MHNNCDFRLLENGNLIPTEYYSDQPYIVKTEDGAWLCTVTTGTQQEGSFGQHVITMRSTDYGKTWVDFCDIEPNTAPESSYSVIFKVSSGRVYCFYNYNIENTRHMRTHVTNGFPQGYWARVDSQGHFFFKYSDDNGKNWSETRYEIPIRETEIDRTNLYGGKIKMFWNVGKPFAYDGHVYVPLHKIGALGEGGFRVSEGVLLHSKNLFIENDPSKIEWETLPDGDVGLRTPVGGGMVAEEQSFCVLSDGSFYCVYRSIDGYPVEAYSYDKGHTFSQPEYKRYADGRPMKHSRAANFAWKCENGKYVYWFHNHGGKDYAGRNPGWICGGEEIDTANGKKICWTQPEICLYDDDVNTIISYPDFVEDNGKYFMTETQKTVGRCHEIPTRFLEKIWNQFYLCEIEKEGLLAFGYGEALKKLVMPVLPQFCICSRVNTVNMRTGVTVDMWCEFKSFDAFQNIFYTMDECNKGISLRLSDSGTIEIQISDGITQNRYRTVPGLLEFDKKHHIVVVIDAGPRIISFVLDGKFCDGGLYKQYGWGRFSYDLIHINGSKNALIGSKNINVSSVRIYGRALMTSECIGNFKSGCNL